ncbi:MAG: hypothetical protein AABX51_07445, partial [Nanoarchaeota archaeon]
FLSLPFLFIDCNRFYKKLSLASLVCFILFSYLLISPFNVHHGRDPNYSYQISQSIIDSGSWKPNVGTGQASVYAYYPGMHFFVVNMSLLMGIDLNSLYFWIFSLLKFAVFPFLIFLIIRELVKPELGLLGVFFYFTTPSLINFPHHENFAIIFFTGAILSAILFYNYRKLLYLFSFFICSIMVLISHHFTSYILIAWLFSTILLISVHNLFINKGYRLKTNFKVIAAIIIIFFVLSSFLIFIGFKSKVLGPQLEGVKKTIQNLFTPRSEEVSIVFAERPDESSIVENEKEANLTEVDQDLTIKKVVVETNRLEYYLKVSSTFIKRVFLNIIDPERDRIKGIEGINFKPIEVVLIGLSALAFAVIFFCGLLEAKKEAKIMLWTNVIFFIGLTALASIFVLTARFYIFRRIFEFSYIGFVPILVLGVVYLQRRFSISKYILPISLFVMLIGGNLLMLGGQQRTAYVTKDRITLDNFMFMTDAPLYAATWFKNIEKPNNRIVGDFFIYDSVGAFGYARVRVFDRDISRFAYRTINQLNRGVIISVRREIYFIATHRYQVEYGDASKDAIDNIEDSRLLNKLYTNDVVNIFEIEDRDV